jgi:uncharacterized membrane-anchored protein YjiN (DUF445 family)
MYEIRDKFHKEIKAFLKDLIKVFPDDRNVKLASSTLTISLMDDPDDKVIKDFYKALSPCEALLSSKDERLFYDNNIKSDVLIFSEIEKYWQQLNADNKVIVWNYITVLYILSKKYLS